MTQESPHALLEAAWADRRRSFDLGGRERDDLVASVRERLVRATAMLREADDGVACAHALHLRAHLEQDIGDVEMAEALWQEAVSLLRTADDPLQLAHKVRHLGDIAVARGRTEEAAGHFDEALRIYRSTPEADDLDLANTLSRVADAKAAVGRIEDARALWLEAKESYAAAGVTEGVLEADRHLRTLEPPPSR